MYHGGFERNRPLLKSGATSFLGSDGEEHPLAPWPKEADGLHIGYMEKPGKKFAVVRLADAKEDIILENEVVLDFTRHLGMGRRLSAEPTLIADETASALLGDIAARNPKQRMQIENFRTRLRRTRGSTSP
jgi:hypothetical protein